MHCLNFGISVGSYRFHNMPEINDDRIQGDRTENVLWRLQNGELDNLSPKVIVVSAGQSNQGDSPKEIAEGVKEICAVIRSKQPQAFLVLLVSSGFTLKWQNLFQFSLSDNIVITSLPQTLLPRGQLPNPLRERNAKVCSKNKHSRFSC